MTITETMAAAERASAAQKWSEAASLWERVYQARQTGPTNLKLVTALVNDKQYLAASTYAAEAEALYLASDSAADLYLTALLKSHQFVPARILRCDRAAASATWRSRALTLIESAEAQAEATLQTTLTTTMRQFYHLSDQPVAAQTERLQAARHLTYAKYLTAAQFLLVDPFLHQLSRVEVLYTLRAMGVSGSVKIRTLKGTELAVVPSALPAMGQDPASLAVLSALQAQLGQSDVGLYDGLEGLLSLQLMYLYPETTEIITDPQAWVRFFIGQQTGHLSEKERAAEPAIAQIQERIQELNRELQN